MRLELLFRQGHVKKLRDVADVELEDEACVKDAIAAIGLEDRVDIWVLVNGTRAGRDTRLSNGAELTFFQPVGGG